MDMSWLTMCKAASCLTKMKRSKLDEPTAKRLRELICESDIIESYQEEQEEELEEEQEHEVQEEEKEADLDQVLLNHETSKNKNGNISGIGVNLVFIRKLKCSETMVESLTIPPLGQAIDKIVLPEFPPIKTLQGQIGDCSIPFEKQLTKTDMDSSQGRLSLCKMVVKDKLKPMLKPSEDLTVGIDVTVYDEIGREFPMSFRFWSNKIYVLTTTGWNKFALENKLRMCEDWVTIWMFRHNHTEELCFAIIPRRFPITKLIGKAHKKGNKSAAGKGKRKEREYFME